MLALVREDTGMSWREVAHTVEAAGSALAVLERGAEEPHAERLFDAPAVDVSSVLGRAEADLAEWEREGIHFLTVLDPEYPPNLRSVHDRPPFLFISGGLSAADERSVAVVGTRRASDAGVAEARSIAQALAEAGFVVVSGLAEGIDTAAHRACLDANGRTVAVIGTGLRRSYPRSNAELQSDIAETGAVVSQFWPDQPPQRHTFPMRNAVMSGLALATVVIEAGSTSGARMQARLALAHGRPVFLSQSLLDHEWAREYAARPGTYVIGSAADVVEALARLEDDRLVLAP